VKPIITVEKWGPLVLLEETRQRWVGQQCEVVAVGDAEYCEDEYCERYEHLRTERNDYRVHYIAFSMGDWLLCRPRCFVATDEPNVWVCKQSDVLARLTLEPDPGVPRR